MVAVRFDGDLELQEVEVATRPRVVDYRAEVVRLYNDFLRRLRESGAPIRPESTPRETESLLVQEGRVSDEKALDQLIREFEEADYSTHPLRRDAFIRAYRAWSKLI